MSSTRYTSISDTVAIETNGPEPLTRRIRRLYAPSTVVTVLILVVVAYYVLFRLPFLFPPHQRLMSASYAFGFNNSVAILGMAGLLALVFLVQLFRRRAPVAPPIAFLGRAALEEKRAIRIAFAIAGLSYAVLTFAMYIYDVRGAPSLMWETRHLLHRTWLMDFYGLRPYTQLSAEYGPILTYAPSLVYWLFRPFNASHEQAYFVAHFLLNLAGLWCAYYVLSRASMPCRMRTVALIVLAIAGFAPWMGINGVLARYLFPFGSLLLGHRLLGFMLARQGFLSGLAAAIAIMLLVLANILLSPEIGLAFAITWIAYAVLNARLDLRILPLSLVAFVAALAFCWLFLPLAYYGTLLRFSEGANNLPLLPAPHLLLYITTLFLLVPPLLVPGARAWWKGDESGAAICGAFGILCVVMSPGALGRCDPPHVLLYGMGASMLLMIRLANVSRRAFSGYVVSYAAVFIFFLEAVNLVVFYGVSLKTVFSKHPVSNLVEKLRKASNDTHPDTAVISALDNYPRLGLPFASFGPPGVEKYVVTSGRLNPEYYVGIVGVYNSAALERKLQDVGKAEYLLVPDFLQADRGPANPCGGYLKSLRQWFFYPAKLPCRADPLDPFASLKSFVAENYAPVEQVGSWWVLRRTGDSANPHRKER